jgi:hypothetical protein
MLAHCAGVSKAQGVWQKRFVTTLQFLFFSLLERYISTKPLTVLMNGAYSQAVAPHQNGISGLHVRGFIPGQLTSSSCHPERILNIIICT